MGDANLRMSFDPHTIEHLGVKMYSNLPNALAELIANAYDAEAKNVVIHLVDDNQNKRIEVIDDGEGMDFDEINNKFLRIGRKRREEDKAKSTSGTRKVTGKKGLGKLAFFGIGDTIEIITIKKDTSQKVTFYLSWQDILNTKGNDYEPKYKIDECDPKEQGTTIILKNLKRKSAFELEDLAVSISKLFNLFDKNFKVYITYNSSGKIKIDQSLKYKNLNTQFKWEFPPFFKNIVSEYQYKGDISGEIMSTEKPLKPGLRGVTLYANGRLVNTPEFFGVSESSHGFSYLTGWLNVDFVDDWKIDVIATDRQSLNWDLLQTTELREFLKKAMSEIERKWREERNIARKHKIKDKTRIDIFNWYQKLPDEILPKVELVVTKIIEESELTDNVQIELVNKLHSLIPEYPYYHWRHLHDKVQDASISDYARADYYRAFLESAKKYINEVRNRSKSKNISDSSMMGEVFGRENSKLHVAEDYRKSDGSTFQQSTLENIEEGQKFLSMGIVSGGRNPVSHEEIRDLRDSGLYTEKDCLDALSLLSHLFRRLEDAKVI